MLGRRMEANILSRRREAHDFNNHVNQGDRASACRRRCLMSDNNALFGCLSLCFRSATCQACPHRLLGHGDLALESLAFLRTTVPLAFYLDRPFHARCARMFVLRALEYIVFLHLVGNALGCTSANFVADNVCCYTTSTRFLRFMSSVLQAHNGYLGDNNCVEI